MANTYPVEGLDVRGLINLQPDETIVRQCDTVKGIPPMSFATHLALTLLTFFTWPIAYCIMVCSWPRINMTVVLTNIRVVFLYNNSGYKKRIASSRAQQHFPLASIAAVQETFGSSSTCCGTQRSVSTIRIWFRAYPVAFPSDVVPHSAIPLGAGGDGADGRSFLKDAVKDTVKDIQRSPDLLSLLFKLLRKGFKRARSVAEGMQGEVKALFIAPDDYIVFPWDAREDQKLSKSNTFVADLCRLVADAQGSSVKLDPSATVQMVDEQPSAISIGEGTTAHYSRQSYGVGSSEVVGAGAMVQPHVSFMDWILSVLTLGVYYFTTIRAMRKTRAVLLTTSSRVITTIITGGGSSYLRITNEEKKRRMIDVRHAFFGGPVLGGYTSRMVTGNCFVRKSAGEIGMFTRFGTIEYCDEMVKGTMHEIMRNAFLQILRDSADCRMFNMASPLEPVKSYNTISDALRQNEVHIASAAGKTRRYLGLFGLIRWVIAAIITCCSGPHETKTSIIVTSERLAVVNELVRKIGGVDYMYVLLFPLSSLKYVAHTDVDMFQNCLGPSYEPIPGFGPAGLLLRSSVGEVRLPFVHLDSRKETVNNLFATLSAVCVQNARKPAQKAFDEEDPSTMY